MATSTQIEWTDGVVAVHAPIAATDDAIDRAVLRRAHWVVRQLDRKPVERGTAPRKIASGAAFRYLGRQYRMRVSKASKNKVALTRGWLLINVTDPSSQALLRRTLDEWIIARARDVFERRISACLSRFPDSRRVEPSGMLIRRLKNRWGSMTASGRIVLNRSLIHAPTPSIDYVVTHELCHRIHPNHAAAFWRALGRAMPDWASRRKRLERVLECGGEP